MENKITFPRKKLDHSNRSSFFIKDTAICVSLLSAVMCIVYARGQQMRKKYTFLLTILPTEDNEDELCGRIQLVQNNRAETFTNLQELRTLINQVLLSHPNDAGNLNENNSVSAPLTPSDNGKELGSAS
jgi:hypothetical protein